MGIASSADAGQMREPPESDRPIENRQETSLGA